MPRGSVSRAAVAVVVALAPAGAAAGRTPYGWIEDVETLVERGAELEAWIGELDGWEVDDGARTLDATHAGWAATIGLTDRLELRLPIEWAWYEGGGTELERWGAEARWRLASPDPEEAPPVVPLVRLRAARGVAAPARWRLEPGAVVSAALGPVRLTADLGVVVELDRDGGGGAAAWLRPGAGVSVGLTDDLRVGVEAAGELGDPDDVDRWFGVGPGAASTHGRTWLSASVLVGVVGVEWAPRLDWGIGF